MSTMRNLLNIIVIVICVCLINWGCTEGAQKRESGEVCSHTVQVSSLFPSSSSPCLLSSKASSNTKSSLRVVHRHGGCSHHSSGGEATTNPDHEDILRLDQARVDYINSKISKDRARPSQSTEVPTKNWGPVPGTYIVNIGIGTPKHELSLIFDTGSDLTWTQCKPCGSCYSQNEPMFDPSLSSSYFNVSCSSTVCGSLEDEDLSGTCTASNCGYRVQYGDNDTSRGFLAREKFTLTDSDFFDGLNFGCGNHNKGRYVNGAAGILGLGRGELSFPPQTAKTYNNIFSYCLPSAASNYTGHLTFGSAGISKSVKYTPVSSGSSSMHDLDIVSITICDKRLEIPPAVSYTHNAIIDSGTVITRLPSATYEALQRAFKEKMSIYKMASSSNASLDTCYDFTGLKTVTIPKIEFSFGGGTVVELDPKGILYPIKISQVCLAFARHGQDTETIIFGNVQQQTLQVVYDGAAQRVGFAPNGCS